MYSGILVSHIIISILLTLLALYILFRSCFGMMGRVTFSKFQDIQLSVVVVVFLYLELILGILLYAIYIKELESLITQDNANTYFSARFWAIEHAILMFFAIIFGHLGLVYARNVSQEKEKFQKNFLYFGLSSILILFSIIMSMLRNV